MKKIAVVGMGYVGIPAAALFADNGFVVTGIQRRSKRSGWKIDLLNSGKNPIGGKEPGLDDLIRRVVIEKKSFHVVDDFSVIKDMDAVLIDVQTPTDEKGSPNYDYLKDVCENIGKFEDNAIITLNFENGIIGFIEVNWLTPMKIRKLFLTCEQNLVELDYIDQSINVSSSYISGKLDKDDLYSIPFESDIRHISVKRSEPLKNELLDFLDAVEKKAKPLVDGKDGVYALEIVDAALKSQEKGKPIFLDV